MFAINEDKSIYLTRGDVAFIEITAAEQDETLHQFKAGDIVRIQVFEKKKHDSVVLRKEVLVEEDTTSVSIYLEKDETKFGEVINKPVDYWYEVELNPNTTPQTIIGYDEDGAKVFRLYPEGRELNE
jgi:hypothetical protein